MDSSKLNINKGFESMLPKASIPNKEEESVRILSQCSVTLFGLTLSFTLHRETK